MYAQTWYVCTNEHAWLYKDNVYWITIVLYCVPEAPHPPPRLHHFYIQGTVVMLPFTECWVGIKLRVSWSSLAALRRLEWRKVQGRTTCKEGRENGGEADRGGGRRWAKLLDGGYNMREIMKGRDELMSGGHRDWIAMLRGYVEHKLNYRVELGTL